MIELKKIDIRSTDQLKKLGFPADEIARYRASANEYAASVTMLDAATKANEWDTVLELEPRVEFLAKYLKYVGQHPKSIPIAELRELAKGADDATEREFRDKISNPATAVRAFCVKCMGGNTAFVRDCEAITCVLWPFRTGKNPLFGQTLPPVDFDMDIDPTEPEETEEETENVDAE